MSYYFYFIFISLIFFLLLIYLFIYFSILASYFEYDTLKETWKKMNQTLLTLSRKYKENQNINIVSSILKYMINVPKQFELSSPKRRFVAQETFIIEKENNKKLENEEKGKKIKIIIIK